MLGTPHFLPAGHGLDMGPNFNKEHLFLPLSFHMAYVILQLFLTASPANPKIHLSKSPDFSINVDVHEMGSKTDAVINSFSCIRPWYLRVPNI